MSRVFAACRAEEGYGSAVHGLAWWIQQSTATIRERREEVAVLLGGHALSGIDHCVPAIKRACQQDTVTLMAKWDAINQCRSEACYQAYTRPEVMNAVQHTDRRLEALEATVREHEAQLKDVVAWADDVLALTANDKPLDLGTIRAATQRLPGRATDEAPREHMPASSMPQGFRVMELVADTDTPKRRAPFRSTLTTRQRASMQFASQDSRDGPSHEVTATAGSRGVSLDAVRRA